MSTTQQTTTSSTVDGARRAADRAAAASGVQVTELTELPAINDAAALFDAVWDSADLMPSNLLRALSHAGNYLAGAHLDGRMVGAIIGFTGLHDGHLVLHSHILGVLEATRGRSVGFALKQHQRAWSLAHGIDRVMWTFDPLVRRNAFFNLSKLAAVGHRYEVNFYGAMPDAINAGDETDRLVALWRLDDPQVVAAADGAAKAVLDLDAAVLLDVGPDQAPVTYDASGDVLRCRVPDDIVALRSSDPAAAQSWRAALRGTLGAALADGYEATGMDRTGWYTLTRRRRG